ncbi:carbon-nitrogen hydrolase family protein [Oxyplasma meridianum]|uniref:Carbon-nitrogen hydrolase family protein n=1 Tax=Oxyplasma meridianum TaxID=3073602 RepID=A0AAX4NGP9_9ARCH
MAHVKVSIVQMGSTGSKEDNLKKSLDILESLKNEKTDLVVFPEYQMYIPDYSNPRGIVKESENISGNFVSAIASSAKKNRIRVLMNMAESNGNNVKPYNTSVFIDDMGFVAGIYRKTHLFDAYSSKESNVYDFGLNGYLAFTSENFTLGTLICYDLRFPEPARMLRLLGSDILSYQAGWFKGERKLDHWKTLIRARAIENGSFVIASSNCNEQFIGHSMAVSPWGDVIAEAEEEETVLNVDLDMGIVKEYAESVPLLKERRRDLYTIEGL